MPNIDSSPLTSDQESKPQNTTSESEHSEEESYSESNPESDPENLAEEFDLFLQLEPWMPLSPLPRTKNPFLMSHQQPSTPTVDEPSILVCLDTLPFSHFSISAPTLTYHDARNRRDVSRELCEPMRSRARSMLDFR